MSCATTWALGLHLLSAHAAPGFEAATVGAYAQAPCGLTVGALRNSERRLSVYAGRTWHTADGRWALTAGGITGYRSAALTPLLVPSLRLPLSPASALRLSLIPKPPRAGGASALHASLEWRL
jgi:hypothetical protein